MTVSELQLTPVQPRATAPTPPAHRRAPVARTVAAGCRAAATYAEWFATLSDATRVRLLHAVATAPARLDQGRRPGRRCSASASRPAPTTSASSPRSASSPSTRSAPPRSSRSTPPAAPACRTPPTWSWARSAPCRAAPRTCRSTSTTRAMADDDLPTVRDIYAEGIATRLATFETEVPPLDELSPTSGCPGTAGSPSATGQVVGWTAISPVSERAVLRRCRRDQRLRHRVRARPRRRQGAAVPAGQRGRRQRPVDAADLGLPREPRLPRAAPLRRLPHPGGAVRGSPSSTGSGATPCCSSAAAPSD